jgi:cation diffusion facilitator CzcD-associated flavoprotein CzcO
MPRPVSVVIVGAGFGGVAAAVRLKEAGVEDLTILERADDVGGVWRANTYPGAACDVPSHLYSLSFAPNAGWSRRFSPQAEIQDYLRDVVDRFDVRRHIRFGADVARATFDEDAGRWRIALDDREELEADVLITACGQLSHPQVPDVPGLDRFAGEQFHSAHWNHDHDLAGRRVAVLGTGASAIQFVPAIADRVAHLTVFQRSAPWTLPKVDRPYGERTRRLHRRVPALARAWRKGWWLYMEMAVPVFVGRPRRLARALAVQLRALSELQRAVQVRFDRDLLRTTRRTDPIGCKRVLVTADWYPTLRRPDVDVVTEPVREVVADGVVTASGEHVPADTIIFGTGFQTTRFLAPMEVHGRDGVALADAWADGAEAYLGIAVPGFPNLFLLYGPNTNHGTGSMVEMLEAQAGYAADAVRRLRDGAARRLEVRRDVHDRFQAELSERLADTVWTGCASWYVTASGRVTNNWPGTQTEYKRRTRRVDLGDYVAEVPAAQPAVA